MPGYRVDALEPVLSGMKCPHCKLILRDAVQTGDGVRLCESCYNKILLAPNHTCSDGAVTVDPQQVWPDRGIRREIGELRVQCSFYIHGCPWQGKLKDLEEHCQDCPYKLLQCPNPGCPELIEPGLGEQHAAECHFRKVNCEYCEEEMCARDIEKHMMTDCPKCPVTCPSCQALTCRGEFEEHKALLCRLEECNVPDCGKLLLRSQQQQTTCEEEYTHQHLADPHAVFQHMQKLATYGKSNRKLLVDLESKLENAQSISPAETLRRDREQLRLLEIETIQSQPSELEDPKIHDLQEMVHSRSDKASQLQREVHTLRTQLKEQSTTLQQLQRQPFQSAGPELKLRESQPSIQQLGRQIALMDIRISELALQLQTSLSSSHDGSYLWKIPDISRRRKDANEERVTSLYSPPFYTGRNGYKMCVRLYLNGDGIGYKTHLSVFFVLMRGECDPLLKWPFESKVSLILVDQNHRKHIVETFKPDLESSSFQRPRSDMNVASGCPQFSKLNILDDDNYVKDDVMFIKCIVDTSRIFHP